MAGRGFGKTRAGAEWIRAVANSGTGGRLALVGQTHDDVRHVMVEESSGVLAVSPPHERPQWLPSRRLLRWPNGVIGRCYSAADPEQLRGPEHSLAVEVAVAFMDAGQELAIPVKWGGMWHRFEDIPHIELINPGSRPQ